MNKKLLLPNRYKTLGWVIFIPSLFCGILKWFVRRDIPWLTWVTSVFYKNVYTDLFHTILIAGIILGGLMIAFSKEKREDEFIVNLRLSSFQWAVLVNYVVLFFCNLFIIGIDFLQVITINMFTTLLLFILRFNYLIYITKKRD